MREPIEKRKTYELIAEQLLAEIGTRLAARRRAADRAGADRSRSRSAARRCARRCACSSRKGVIEPVGNGDVRRRRARAARSTARSRSCSRSTRPTCSELLRAAPHARGRGRRARRRAALGRRDLATMATAIDEMARGLGDRRDATSRPTCASTSRSRRRRGTASRCTRCTRSATCCERALEQVYRIPGSAGALARAAPRRSSPRSRPATPRRRAAHARAPHARRARDPRSGHLEPARDFARRRTLDERSSAMAEIGYVGLGVMGGGVARRLLEAGHDGAPATTARASKAEPLVDAGCALRRHAARGRRAERRRLLDGHEHDRRSRPSPRAPTGSSPGSAPGKVYVDMSTVSPAASRALAERVRRARRRDARRARLRQRDHARAGQAVGHGRRRRGGVRARRADPARHRARRSSTSAATARRVLMKIAIEPQPRRADARVQRGRAARREGRHRRARRRSRC